MQILDRRLNPGGKSLENRQRFLRRARAVIQRAVRDSSQDRNIPDILQGGEISIPPDGLGEPRFRPGQGGIQDAVLPGNRTYTEGDYIPRPEGGSGGQGSGAGQGGGDSEDAFRFMLTREEFLDLFLEDLELPDLAKRRLADVEREGVRRAGYTVSGSPVNLAVTQTMRLALARRIALRRPRIKEVEQLEAELADCTDESRRVALQAEIDRLRTRMRRIPYIDPIDIRFRRFETVPRPIAQAVMFCLMDVSGSMSEHMKDLAKRFYMLLYIFLTKRYRHVEIVFIRHTDRAEEVDEETFFRSPATGGTLVSSALEAMQRIVRERYRPEDWNIYAAQASDGDNAYGDSEMTASLLTNAILPVSQYFAYLEVGEAGQHDNPAMPNSALWGVYERLRSEGHFLAMRKVSDRSEIYPVFRDLFQRRREAKAVA
jgi:uncharacterized sporulation protein YeaH/YhbH (DUF444 family)